MYLYLCIYLDMYVYIFCVGSGKSLAYLLPILSNINTKSVATQALIIVPTRELAVQVCIYVCMYEFVCMC